jgi:DMSO/TMAO reductase YedYZ molybdopterin-dependent catalytic subunit
VVVRARRLPPEWEDGCTCEGKGRGRATAASAEGAGQLEMTQPETGARDRAEAGHGVLAAGPVTDGGEVAGPASVPGEPGCGGEAAADGDAARRPALPPGQYIPRTLPVLHYGPVPTFNPLTWDMKISGATESGTETQLRWQDMAELPVSEVTADFHCVTKFTVPGIRWAGILASEILYRFPPAPAVTHVMIYADFGYSANVRITDFAADDTLLATHRDGVRLTPDHGYPLRLVVPSLYAWKSVKWVRAIEYLTTDRRGFWEERGYHNTADPWREQRYSYQELDGEGPPL